MKPRKLYLRRKGKSIIIEGKKDGKSVLIWTIPEPNIFMSKLLENSSFFTQEKVDNIGQKLSRLDIREQKQEKGSQEVRSKKIVRIPEKDES